MQTAEIKELYEQKTGAPPGPAVSKFIDGLKVREVARIWSMMGEGEDFVGAIKRLIADAIKKAGGGGEEIGHMELDQWLEHLEELKDKAEREKQEKALEAQRERERLAEERRAAEEAEERRLREEAEEEQRRAEQEAQEKEEAAQRAAEAAERERAAQAAAEKAAAEREEAERLEKEAAEQAAKDEAEKAALEARLAEARRAKAEAEAAQEEAHRRLEEEKRAAEEVKKRSDAMAEAQRLMKEELEQKRAAEEAERRRREEELRRREEEAERRRVADEEAQKAADAEDAADDDDDSHTEGEGSKDDMRVTVTVKLNDADENLGLHGVLCIGKKVRAVELVEGGAAQRAGLRPATLLCSVHGKEINSKEDLRVALQEVRKENLTEFEMVVEMPLTKDELEMGMAKARDARRRAAKAKVLAAMDTAKVMIIDMCVVRAKNLAGSSKNVFLECKLRQVKDGKVQSDHPNPQKSVSPTIKGTLDPVFDHKVRFVVPPNDCIRISIFGAKAIGKEYKGRVDLVLRDVVPSLNVGGKALIFQYPVTGEEEGRGEVGGLLEVACRVKGFVRE